MATLVESLFPFNILSFRLDSCLYRFKIKDKDSSSTTSHLQLKTLVDCSYLQLKSIDFITITVKIPTLSSKNKLLQSFWGGGNAFCKKKKLQLSTSSSVSPLGHKCRLTRSLSVIKVLVLVQARVSDGVEPLLFHRFLLFTAKTELSIALMLVLTRLHKGNRGLGFT